MNHLDHHPSVRTKPAPALQGPEQRAHLQTLEPRRLLALSPDGATQFLQFNGFVSAVDIASAPDGNTVIAAHLINLDTTKELILAIRLDPTGQQIGDPFVVASWDHPTDHD